MFRRIALIVATLPLLALPALTAEPSSVAGRPALATDSLDALIKQREQWGTAPSKGAAAPAAVAPLKKALKPVPRAAPKKAVPRKATAPGKPVVKKVAKKPAA
ncbi:MAG: hypothetical protein AB7E80_00025 [Hyphomicrobiaceae bacterium]